MQLPLTPELWNYIENISLPEHPSLYALRQETAKLPLALMQISPLQAQFLQFLIRLIRAKNVLELGTFTGYSALAMALALPEDGHLITCDRSKEWTDKAHPYWEEALQNKKITLKLGPALQTLDALLEEGYAKSFDFIFIDADKTNYIHYYEKALQLVTTTGLIAIDNIFWHGKVIDKTNNDAQTREIRRLNEHIKQDTRVDTSLLPIGDGLFLIKLKEFVNESTYLE